MMEIRQLLEHERTDAIQLSDKVFRDHDHKSMGEAFPYIFSSSMIGHSFGAFVKGELVSFMGLVPSLIRIGNANLKVYSLGSVCTAEEHRGKGIASQILKHVITYLENTDTSMLLVSGDRTLYTRVNCCHFGTFKQYHMRIRNIDDQNNQSIREMNRADLLQMHSVAQQRSIAYEQSVTDLQIMLHAEANASCYKLVHKTLIFETDGRISSFLVLGVPYTDSQHQKAIAIEWAGVPKEVVQLINYGLHKYNLEEIGIQVPWQEHQLELELNGNSYTHEQNQGTVYIVNPEHIVNQLQPYFSESFKDTIQFEKVEHGNIELNVTGNSMKIDEKDFISFLFDKNPKKLEILEFQKESGGLFPIPFPYTAGLNYA